jgi:endonuclease/exonuclease/phosphatase family metal-dependent hydrolase
MAIRIASFNCENLFSRPKVFNLSDSPADSAKSNAALKAAVDLKKILEKKTYTAADKTKILDLIAAGKGFFSLEKDKGTLVSGKRVVANGSGDFVGRIQFLLKEVSEAATENTGKVIKALNADVLCTVEVEHRETLGRFNSQVLKTRRFQNHMVIDGNDDRGIDVGLMSNLRIRNMRSHVDDKEGNSRIFSRDCIEYEVVLEDGRSLWILCNHLKSKGFGSPATNDARRKQQATRIAAILAENYNLATDLVVVAGDLNDTPDSDALSPLMAVPNLHNIVDTLPEAERYTYIFRSEKTQIDYLLVSTPLRDAMTEVKIERRGMFKVPGRFASITKESESASDHGAVVAEFAI